MNNFLHLYPSTVSSPAHTYRSAAIASRGGHGPAGVRAADTGIPAPVRYGILLFLLYLFAYAAKDYHRDWRTCILHRRQRKPHSKPPSDSETAPARTSLWTWVTYIPLAPVAGVYLVAKFAWELFKVLTYCLIDAALYAGGVLPGYLGFVCQRLGRAVAWLYQVGVKQVLAAWLYTAIETSAVWLYHTGFPALRICIGWLHCKLAATAAQLHLMGIEGIRDLVHIAIAVYYGVLVPLGHVFRLLGRTIQGVFHSLVQMGHTLLYCAQLVGRMVIQDAIATRDALVWSAVYLERHLVTPAWARVLPILQTYHAALQTAVYPAIHHLLAVSQRLADRVQILVAAVCSRSRIVMIRVYHLAQTGTLRLISLSGDALHTIQVSSAIMYQYLAPHLHNFALLGLSILGALRTMALTMVAQLSRMARAIQPQLAMAWQTCVRLWITVINYLAIRIIQLVWSYLSPYVAYAALLLLDLVENLTANIVAAVAFIYPYLERGYLLLVQGFLGVIQLATLFLRHVGWYVNYHVIPLLELVYQFILSHLIWANVAWTTRAQPAITFLAGTATVRLSSATSRAAAQCSALWSAYEPQLVVAQQRLVQTIDEGVQIVSNRMVELIKGATSSEDQRPHAD
ncbi:hypothetical protein IWQ60_008399 [Tieghemiomyces parasiticus]|uniref:Uncharacterized protein n=1 Tax=Tieghemiomyces parasiticus TaxID=78921 RepID=A0A9W8DLR0_9FUNG|nr:hypothetical protein IWQ60_008399 [Tieghemiomyces parasiticus]